MKKPWKRSSSGLTSITLPNGTEVLADDETRRFFEDAARPEPSNESLSRILSQVARVRIFDGGMSQAKPLSQTVLLDLSDAKELADLFERLAIVEPAPGFHCMCYGDQALELRSRDGTVLAVLGLHHGVSIRWDEWSSDAELQNGLALLDWLGRHGVVLPEQRLDAALKAGVAALDSDDTETAESCFGTAVRLAAESGDDEVLEALSQVCEIIDPAAGRVRIRPRAAPVPPSTDV